MKSAGLPKPDGPKVKFGRDGPVGDKAPSGMDNIHDDVLEALAKKKAESDRLDESAIVHRLTEDYGGLIYNALRLFKLLQPLGDTDMFRKEGGVEEEMFDPASGSGLSDRDMDTASHIAHPSAPLPAYYPPPPLATVVSDSSKSAPTVQARCVLGPGGSGPLGPPLFAKVCPTWAPPNVFANISPPLYNPNTPAWGASDAFHPRPGQDGTKNLMSAIFYNMDRLENPAVQTKPCTLGGVKINGEIWVYMARFVNNYKVPLSPWATGKQHAIGLKALNDRLRPLYDLHDLPCGLTNRFCIGAASMTWGGRPSDPDYLMSEQDFLSWAPSQVGSYTPL